MNTFPRWLLALLVFLLLTLVAGGAWFYRAQREHLRREVEADLGAIAQLKADEIAAWRAERLGDAAVLAESGFFAEGVARWMERPESVNPERFLSRFRAIKKHYHYHDVILVDVSGEARLSLRERAGPLHPEAAAAVAVALAEQRPLLTDLHDRPGDLPPHLDAVAPLFSGSGDAAVPVGAVILQADARQFLYPLIQSWPTHSHSAESLLVRRDGDDVLFLNDLRHRGGTAFALRIPLTRTEVPAVKAVLGRQGIARGMDYRGVRVLSALYAVPDSDWFLVAKMDEAEAFAEWRFRSLLILGLLIALAAGAVALVLTLWQRNAKAHYRALFQVEAARRAGEQRYRVTLMSIGDAVITADAAGRVELLNPVAEALTGWSAQEARGKPLEEVFKILNEETRAPVESPARRAMHEGAVVGLANHTLLVARDGTERPIADSGAPIHDATGAVSGVVLVFRDQSDERAARRALEESQAFVYTVLDHLPIGIAVNSVEPSVEFLYMNDNFPRFYRTTRQALAEPDRFWEAAYQDPVFREALRQRVLADCVSGDPERMYWEDVPITREGEPTTYICARNIVIPDKDLMISTVWDVTQRKQAEAALQLFQALVDRSHDAFEVLDPETGRFLAVNQKGCEDLGYSREELLRMSVFDVDPMIDREAFTKNKEEARSAAGHIWRGVHQRRDGSAFPVEVTVRSVQLDREYLVAVVRDTTERMRAEEERERLQEQLSQAQKMEAVGRLAGGVAHDFNNMLQAILGNTDLALMDAPQDSPLCETLGDIRTAAERAADLTRQLLAFARKQTISPQVLDLNDSVSAILKMLRRLIGEDIDLAWLPGHDLWPVHMDPSQLDQILANLAVNARDAIGGVGKLTIETENVVFDEEYCEKHADFLPGEYVLLGVSDDGAGMDEATRERVFEPFFTTKEHGRGTGLGLATVFGIVKQNEGFINVYSEPGYGATFKIYLPRHAGEAAARAAEERSAAMPGGSETLLIVEDEPMILQLAATTLEGLGYQVLTADAPGQALRLAAEHAGEIHLLVTDMVMPEMNGRQLAERLLALRPGLKCVFTSGYTANVIAHHGVLEEGVRFLQKPFSLGALARKVREALDAG